VSVGIITGYLYERRTEDEEEEEQSMKQKGKKVEIGRRKSERIWR